MAKADNKTDSAPNIRQEVKEALESELKGTKQLIKGFVYGLGLLVILLLGSGLVSKGALVRGVHDWIFGFDASLQRALGESVAVSYSTGFWLHPRRNENFQNVPFYAGRNQAVEVKVRLLRDGTQEYYVVAVLDLARIDSTESVHPSHKHPEGWYIDVSGALAKTPRDAEPVHILTFVMPLLDDSEADSVFLEPLITVRGLEGGD